MAKRFNRVLLYVGAPKTGTTTLQHFFINNEAHFAAQGFHVPKAGRLGFQHIELPAVFGRRRKIQDAQLGIQSDITDRRSAVVAGLNA